MTLGISIEPESLFSKHPPDSLHSFLAILRVPIELVHHRDLQQPRRTRNTRDYQPGQMSRYVRLSEAKAGEGWDVSLQDVEPGESGSAGGEKFPERYAKLLRLYYLNTSGAGR